MSPLYASCILVVYSINSFLLFYSLWGYGKPASEALEYLAKYGITRRLEAQMKLFSNDIRYSYFNIITFGNSPLNNSIYTNAKAIIIP